MKTKLSVLTALCLCILPLAVGPGCITTSTPVSQATIDATAALLEGAAESGALAAIQQDPTSAKYFQLAADSLSTFLTATNYSPTAFQAALLKVLGTNGVVSNPYVQIAVGTVVDLYQLYFGNYVKGQVSGNAYASEFITAVQNGFYLALGRTPAGLKRVYAARSHSAYTGPVLPRRVSP